MATTSLEQRVAILESEIAEIKKQLTDAKPQPTPWWKAHFGAFKDDPYYEEATRLGAEYRRAQPTAADEDAGDVPAGH